MNDYYKKRKEFEGMFLRDVKDHELIVLRDELIDENPCNEDTLGHYRHIKCKNPESYNMSFEIISVPYYLTMVGDMGSWTWSRLKDNFCFFRADKGSQACAEREGKTLFTNPGYWAEKLQAVDKIDGLSKYSEDSLKSNIVSAYERWLDDEDPNAEERNEVKEAVRDELFSVENEYEAHDALRNFGDCDHHGFGAYFTDAWEWTLTEYTRRYYWACYAVAWTVREYDKLKENT